MKKEVLMKDLSVVASSDLCILITNPFCFLVISPGPMLVRNPVVYIRDSKINCLSFLFHYYLSTKNYYYSPEFYIDEHLSLFL